MNKKRKRRRRYRLTTQGKIFLGLVSLLLIIIIALIVMFIGSLFSSTNNDKEIEINVPSTTPLVSSQPIQTTLPTPSYDTTSPESITVIANKKHSLGDYAPTDLVEVSHAGSSGTQYMREEAAQALEQLLSAADQEGITLYAQSGYRSYSTQESLYNSYAARDGYAAADTYSSRAGYSDHQTGLAMDIMGENTRMNASDRSDCPIEQCEGSPASLWLEEHAADYGFILRFPEGKEDITGYVYEWWHYRYVGIDLAKEIKASNLTMEEFFNVEGGDYQQ